MEDQDALFVTLLDESGVSERFELIMTFDYEGARYAALLPAGVPDAANAGAEEEAEVVLLEIVRGGDGEVYRPVENPILRDEVFAEFLALLDEQEGEDRSS